MDTGGGQKSQSALPPRPVPVRHVDYFVHRAGDLLEHIHIQDADGYADRHWAVGRGTVNWHAVFTAIAKLESEPRLIMEIRDKAGILPSAEYLGSLQLAR